VTLSREDMLQIIDDLYAATGSGNFEKAADMLTDDFFVSEADSLPMAGIYRGKDALKDLYLNVMGLMDVAGLERGEVTTGGDYAICPVTFKFADPALAPAELLELFRFRGRLVCEIKPYYFDPAPIVAACDAKRLLDTQIS
jgi:hypothetical protein